MNIQKSSYFHCFGGWESVKEKTPEKMVLMLSLAVAQVLRGVEGTLYVHFTVMGRIPPLPSNCMLDLKLQKSWNVHWGHKAGKWERPRLCRALCPYKHPLKRFSLYRERYFVYLLSIYPFFFSHFFPIISAFSWFQPAMFPT